MSAIGLELLVDDLDRAIELFTSIMGCTLLRREKSTLMDGEVASLDAGNIVISLIKPTPYGPGAALSEQQPRLTQLIFAASPDAVRHLHARAVEAGASIAELHDGRIAVVPEAVYGATGISVSLVTVPVERPPAK